MQAPAKSQVEFYLNLSRLLVLEDPLQLTTPKSLRRDVLTLESRTANEGLSFLTKTLPKLGKAFDQGLASTHFSLPREFQGSHDNRSIPAFMQAYFKCVFDESGDLRPDVDPACVDHIRQVLFLLYKLELPYHPKQEEAVIQSFLLTERELEIPADVETDAIIAAASYIARDVFAGFNWRDIVPKHGPGSVATGERLEQKWVFSRLYRDIHQVYPYYDYFIVGGSRELIDRLAWYKQLRREQSGTAKVVLVPKDSRGPRLISCEPLEFQWIQQGLGRKLVSHLESFRMTKGQINFTHQEINRELALKSSSDLKYSTIDLKDASDRVSVDLVKRVFAHTELVAPLMACRTTATRLPSGDVIPLRKYAPMGSALCFPVEAFIFWCIIVAAISRNKNLQPAQVGKSVYVYGDDIIIPLEWTDDSIQALERVRLRVNREKCCIQGPFRESCGMDAFNGRQVTPIRVKTLWSNQRRNGECLSSYTSYFNSLRQKGYKLCSQVILSEIERVHGRLPMGTSSSGFPCIVNESELECLSYNLRHFKSRFRTRYQRHEFLVTRLKPVVLESSLDGWARLLRDLNQGAGPEPSLVVLPRSSNKKLGWSAL